MGDEFLLIPGRTTRQGTSMNEGKTTAGYTDEVNAVQLNEADMARLGLSDGDRVRLTSAWGTVEVACRAATKGELPAGLLFMAYGDASSKLMGGETHGTGMPTSKGFEVRLERVG